MYPHVGGIRPIAADEQVIVGDAELAGTREVGLLQQGAEIAAVRLPDQEGNPGSLDRQMECSVGADDQQLPEGPDRDLPRRAEQLDLVEGPADEHRETWRRVGIDEQEGALLVVTDGGRGEALMSRKSG